MKEEIEVDIKDDLGKLIIDEYHSNGFNQTKAVQTYCPNISDSNARTYYRALVKDSENKIYISDKLTALRASTQIKAIHVLRELINFSFSDITDYMDLSVADLKELPGDLRRSIQTFENKTTRYLPRGAQKGEEVTETNVKIKLFDKIKSLEMIAKHIGLYEKDNKQRAVKIDLSKATNVQLNILLNMAVEEI